MAEQKRLTPIKAIRVHCLDCCCGNPNEVRLCVMENKCSLYPYRFGKNPNIAPREYTEEQKQAIRERGEAYRLKVKEADQDGES